MNIRHCLETNGSILMEGALGERLKREYSLCPDPTLAWAALVYSEAGRAALSELWGQYIGIARQFHLPFMATTPTRRTNQQRIQAASCSKPVIRDNVEFLREIQRQSGIEMYVGGLMGCRGDAYTGEGNLQADQAREFHSWQAGEFAQSGVDFVFAGIMPTLPEAMGMAQALSDTGIPYIISFTVERSGRLIDCTTVHNAISQIDQCAANMPLCYMANCVHPAILYEALAQPCNDTDAVKARFLGVQGNTSPLPYAELDGAVDLKCSGPAEFAKETLRLKQGMGLKIIGGCCGTDSRHMEAIAGGMVK